MARRGNFLYVMSVIIIAIIMTVFSGVGKAYAATTTSSDIMKELATLTIDEKKFAEADYPTSPDGLPQVLYLHESGYTVEPTERVPGYALTLYLYNPAQLNIITGVRHAVQVKIGNAERWSKYKINYITASDDRRFIKFKVALSGAERAAALASLESKARRYDISGIELLLQGASTATEYTIGRTFTYSGCSDGNGHNALKAALSYTVEGGTEVIPLNVKHTSWRPKGTNGKSLYTQDTVHSVYFAVPKEYDDKYDYLQSIKAQWLEARLAPIYVTGNEELYYNYLNLIEYNKEKQLAVGSTKFPDKFDYTGMEWALWASDVTSPTSMERAEIVFARNKDLNYKINGQLNYDADPSQSPYYDDYVKRRLESLGVVIKADADSIDNYYVSSKEIQRVIENAANDEFNDKAVADRLPSYLFENYEAQAQERVIKIGAADEDKDNELIITEDKLNLHSESLSQKWWQKVFTGAWHTTNEQDFKNIKAIQEVNAADIARGADALYINERDFDDFKSFYYDHRAEATVYIMRYAVSEYTSIMTYEFKCEQNGLTFSKSGAQYSSNKGYFAQAEAYLDFDIIEFEYKKNDESYILPVSMSPLDIYDDITPPVLPVQSSDFWKIGVIMIAALILIGTVYLIIETKTQKEQM